MGGVSVDWTLQFRDVLQIGVFVVGMIGSYFALRFDIRFLTHRVDATEEKIKALNRELGLDNDSVNLRMGELGTALRTEIGKFEGQLHKFELYVRDEFVRREGFNTIMAKLQTEIETMGTKSENRLLRMENSFLNHKGGGKT